MTDSKTAFLLQCLVFCIPLNIYVIGDYMGSGIQWALFKYQMTYLGESVISFVNEVGYVHAGFLQGKSALALIVWAVGALVLIACFIINLLALGTRSPSYIQKTFLGVIFSGLLFLAADILQYGPAFHSAAGYCIPIGIPLVFILGIWGYRNAGMPGIQSDAPLPGDDDSVSDIRIPGISLHAVKKDLLVLVPVSVFVKIILFFVSLYAPYYVITGDIGTYYRHAQLFLEGYLPYIDTAVEYPPFFFIPVMIAVIPSIFLPGFSVYLLSYISLMFCIDAVVLVLVYLIAFRLFGQEKAFLSGLLYATAVSAEFFVPLTYDVVASFFLMGALFLFLNRKEIPAFVAATTGTLVKWFPVFSMPFFFIHAVKTGRDIRTSVKGIAIAALLFLAITLPLLVINYRIFSVVYLYHLSREVQSHSLIYYVEILCQQVFPGITPSQYAFVLLAILEIVLLYWFWRFPSTKEITLVYFIFFSVFFFVLLNKIFSASYIIWLTPFLALLLVHSIRQIILFYLLEIVVYVETPLLYRIVYGSGQPYQVFENSLPSFSFIFYTVKFVIYITVFIIILNDLKKAGSRAHHPGHSEQPSP